MKILYDILNELNYSSKDCFSFSFSIKGIEKQCYAMPFTSEEYSSQVYLVVQVSNSELSNILDSDFLLALAKAFRKQNFHKSDMDKNTTLLIECACKEGEYVDHLSKVQIEDDPYYFKKYVFAYSTLELSRAEEYIRNQKAASVEKFSYVREIQSYLSNADTFASYKTNHTNQPTYAFFCELVTKVPIFPLRITAVDEIKPVADFLHEEFEKMPSTDINALDQLLNLIPDFKETSIESVLSYWSSVIDS